MPYSGQQVGLDKIRKILNISSFQLLFRRRLNAPLFLHMFGFFLFSAYFSDYNFRLNFRFNEE